MSDPMPPGPYVNDGGEWWVPVFGISYLAARLLVRQCMWGGRDSKLVYHGKVEVWLDTEHEAGCEDDCPSLHHVLAWHFEEVER